VSPERAILLNFGEDTIRSNMADFSQKQLEEMVDGKPEMARATFFEKARLDVSESKRLGKRFYRPTVYVSLHSPGITDTISYPAKKADFNAYPEEYAYFQSHRDGDKKHVKIDIIPGLDITHKQELIDMGLSTIERLSAALTVPPHLEYARISALAFNAVLQEQANVRSEEESVEEAPQDDITNETRHTGSVPRPEPDVLEVRGRADDCNVIEHILPPSERGREERGSEGMQTGRRIDSDKAVNWTLPSSNWKIPIGT
jgi:hypothetical protein